MKIETHRIPSRGTTLNYHKEVGFFTALKKMVETGECRFNVPLVIDLEMIPARDIIEVTGRLSTVARLSCSRCLVEYDLPLNHQFHLLYSQKIPKSLQTEQDQSVELTAEQIGVIYYKGEIIDFTEAVQEQVVLALPYKPLCKQNCKGLCVRCGIDLNHQTCQCDKQSASSPFEGLKGLKLPKS